MRPLLGGPSVRSLSLACFAGQTQKAGHPMSRHGEAAAHATGRNDGGPGSHWDRDSGSHWEGDSGSHRDRGSGRLCGRARCLLGGRWLPHPQIRLRRLAGLSAFSWGARESCRHAPRPSWARPRVLPGWQALVSAAVCRFPVRWVGFAAAFRTCCLRQTALSPAVCSVRSYLGDPTSWPVHQAPASLAGCLWGSGRAWVTSLPNGLQNGE